MRHLEYQSNPSDGCVAAWIDALNINHAPVRAAGVKTSLKFIARHMKTLPSATALSFLRCIDLSKPVREQRLRPGEILVAYRALKESPVRLFYTRKGYLGSELGVNFEGKVRKVFRVTASLPALESYTSSAIDTWSKVQPGQDFTLRKVYNPDTKQLEWKASMVAPGRGLQLMIPDALSGLKCLNP